MDIKQVIKSVPVIGPVAIRIYRTWISPPQPFQGSESYWKSRYEAGGNSGNGSYNKLAGFKAEILNTFVSENGITSIIEYGCGDGNQLSLAQYPKYTGFDVSQKAIDMCLKRFSKDETKTFKLMCTYAGESAELTLSLDVIYHLIEDSVFAGYMNRLFDSSNKFVAIYSSDTDENVGGGGQHT
ncbi:MAG: class I SAM-dependent methyltransferase [Desulfamplus sp.]|nr:class I SAM-dependent methyltransferase [Desulfamplus sp.]